MEKNILLGMFVGIAAGTLALPLVMMKLGPGGSGGWVFGGLLLLAIPLAVLLGRLAR